MDGLKKRAETLREEVKAAVAKLEIDEKQAQLEKLKLQSQQSDFWQDNIKAQEIMKQIAELESQTGPWLNLQTGLVDLAGLIEIVDANMKAELEQQLAAAEVEFNQLKRALRFTGPYDSHGAIVSIHAGAGGTDAQDWTQILFRMYSRFTGKHGLKLRLLDESAGEEAGLKSVTFEVGGSQAYGRLKGEQGVHRLVRLSPFNSDNLRQTSFAKVEVMPEIDKPDEVELDEKDLKIDVYRSGGHGGQSVNTTDSAVRVTHIPTGITVAIQNERSQLQNKETALTILRSKLAQLQLDQHAEKISQLKGENEQAAWGNQIRNYVLHPYKQVKDLRTNYTTSDAEGVLDGDLQPLIDAYLEQALQL